VPETRILSQAPALAQVELWLDKHLPFATREETQDTAESVLHVMNQDNPHVLAVASKHAAELYGGHIIAGPINDDPHNYTRFVLLQKQPVTPENANRTSIILTTDNAPGALYNALGIFARQSINLSKLDSHPIPRDTRRYAFYIDFEASVQARPAQAALAELKQAGYTAKVLGSYHVA
jgi:prephenate dehydratase